MAGEKKNCICMGLLPIACCRSLNAGIPACTAVTLVDGIVLSRSAFDHSMNYRSVVAFGTAKKILDPVDKV